MKLQPLILTLSIIAAATLAACPGEDIKQMDTNAGLDAAPRVCDVEQPACPDPLPRYSDVAPIFEDRCLTCHHGESEQWPLTSYPHVAAWAGEIRDVMTACAMPPPESGMGMATAERERILEWIRCGFPE